MPRWREELYLSSLVAYGDQPTPYVESFPTAYEGPLSKAS